MKPKKLGKKARKKGFNSWVKDKNFYGLEFYVHKKYKTYFLTEKGKQDLENLIETVM